MGNVDAETIDIKGMDDSLLRGFMKKNCLSLKPNEARRIVELVGRNPTLTELHIFNIQWSEHSSYKSSKKALKTLPTKAPNVILGPVEDSGIVELGIINGERYGVVISHESHNHPSQVVPYEGAATGIGGDLRDVLCMGAKIIATADPLRFGNPYGKNKNRVKYIANEVVNGIAGYGNPVGIPNLAGDVYFNESFDDNCLVNVVCLGVIKEKDIIHSRAPENSEGYDIIIVGKATDNSGFGGAAFASLILDEEDRESNRGAVQVPDPFLKNMLIRATYDVFEQAKKQKIVLGFKDMGAGGIMCATSELCSSAGVGCELDIDKIHVSMKNLPPFIIAASETQERFTWISPKSFTPTILRTYNEDYDLPNIAQGARASVIGFVTKNTDYVVRHNGKVICNAPVDVVTSGILYDREARPALRSFKEPLIPEPVNYNDVFLKVLSNPNVASKARLYKHYDTEVMGTAVIRPGEADAGLIKPLFDSDYGIALSVDCNPKYNRISPYYGAAAAVAESMRNIAAIGAIPSALTDCLCYGNPEKPEVFWDFSEGVRGIKDAAENIRLKGTNYPVPIVSGNVSFYNESAAGKAVDPSPIIACVGIIKDYKKAITMQLKQVGSVICMIGQRKDELGGSVYYELHNEVGSNVPKADFKAEEAMIYGIIDCIDKGMILSCHDISDGGMAACISEMMLGAECNGSIGAEIDIDTTGLRQDKAIFSESPGFVFEADYSNMRRIEEVFGRFNVDVITIGKTTGSGILTINNDGKRIIRLGINELKDAWSNGFVNAVG